MGEPESQEHQPVQQPPDLESVKPDQELPVDEIKSFLSLIWSQVPTLRVGGSHVAAFVPLLYAGIGQLGKLVASKEFIGILALCVALLSVATSRQSTVLANTPWVSILDTTTFSLVGDKYGPYPNIKMSVRNEGNSPALHLWVHTELVSGNAKDGKHERPVDYVGDSLMPHCDRDVSGEVNDFYGLQINGFDSDVWQDVSYQIGQGSCIVRVHLSYDDAFGDNIKSVIDLRIKRYSDKLQVEKNEIDGFRSLSWRNILSTFLQ